MNHLLKNLYAYIKTRVWYRNKFYSIGKRTVIHKPLKLDAAKSISIGKHTNIAQGAWLMGRDSSKTPTLKIGNNVQIGHHCHITGLYDIDIRDSVLIADKVYISDCTHAYQDINIPIYKQDVEFISNIIIGEESWIGENVVIMGAKIGKHCVVGANSVVNKDIPDYCVAVGNPVRIIKHYDEKIHKWIKVAAS